MRLIDILRRRQNSPRQYQPLIEILISRSRLLNNLENFRAASDNLAIAPVLKSNAYGHGLVQVGKILDKQDLPFLIIDSLFEAMVLRGQGIKSSLLIIGYTRTASILKKPQKNITFSLTTLQQINKLSQSLHFKQTFHLKVDTGMHRQGLTPDEISQALRLIGDNPNIKLEGVFSHLADADTPESAVTDRQINLWNQLVERVKKQVPRLKYWHLAASAGLTYSSKIKANLGRLGLGLYGITPGSGQISTQTQKNCKCNLFLLWIRSLPAYVR